MRRLNQKALRASVILSTLLAVSGLSGCGKAETSASLLADAKQYQQKGDQKAALIQLKNAASKNPDDAEVRYALASLYTETGDAVSAEKEIRRAISLGVDRARALPLLAKSLLQQGKAKETLEASDAGAAQAGPDLLVTRGDAFAMIDDIAKATAAYEAALAAKPGAAGALIGLARLAMVRQDVAAATDYVQQATVANPKDPSIWMFKGAMLRATGKNDEAKAAYDEVVKLKPDHMNALLERAQIHIDAQEYPAAQTDVDAARKAAPNALIVMHTQAVLHFKQSKFAAAKESLQQVSKLAPEFMPGVLLSGAVDLNLGAYKQAEESLKRYVDKHPDNAYARKLLAQAMLKNSRPADAAAALAPLINESTQDGQLMALAGLSAAQSSDPAKAAGYFQRASILEPQSAAIRTSLGLAKLGSGNTAGGIAELEKAVELNPASEEAVLALVRAHLGMKQQDRALAVIVNAEKQHANSAQLQNLKGGVYLAKRDISNARASFEKAAASDPSDLSPVMNLAQLDLQKNPGAAQKRIEAFLDKNKKNANAMFALAELASNQGQKTQATVWLEKAVTENPGATEPLVRLGAHYLANGQNDKALSLARKARATAPDNNELADLLGQAQIANKDFSAALETYAALSKALPKSAAAQVRLARVHVLLKDNAAAAEDLKRAVSVQPDYMPARLAQIELAARFGKPEDALAMARRMQTDFANSPIGYIVEGDVNYQLQRPAQALPAYEKALALNKVPAVMIKVADALRRTGKAKEAENRLAQWVKANPGDDTVQIYLAELHLANKQYKSAASQYEDLIKRQPGSPVLLNNLAWSYHKDKDSRALATAERAIKLAPDDAAVLDTLGWILSEQGDTARALPLLKKAVAAAPNALDTRYHLAATLSRSGDKTGARKELEKLLSENKTFAEADAARALLKSL